MENQYRKRVAKNVRAYRKKMALSQESLAERAEMHWTFISGVERCPIRQSNFRPATDACRDAQENNAEEQARFKTR